jgi:hypothetical protein
VIPHQLTPVRPGPLRRLARTDRPVAAHSRQPHHVGAGTKSGLTRRDRACPFASVGAAVRGRLNAGKPTAGLMSGMDGIDGPRTIARNEAQKIHEGPLPKGGEVMRVSGSERWCSLTHKAAKLRGQREETPHQPPAPCSGGARKCAPHLFSSGERTDEALARKAQTTNDPRGVCGSRVGVGSERSSLTRNLSRGSLHLPGTVIVRVLRGYGRDQMRGGDCHARYNCERLALWRTRANWSRSCRGLAK